MKQRMITVVYGITLLLVILLFYSSVLFNIALAAVTTLAVYEIFTATKCKDNKGLMAICIVFAAVVPFLGYFHFADAVISAYFLFMFAIFVYMLFRHKTVRLEHVSLCFMMTLLTTSSISCMIFMRDKFNAASPLKDDALLYIALVFIGAWVTDAGGYIFGRLFGKHKLSPSISPKKTIEGAIGGILLTLLASVGMLYGYSIYLSLNDVHAHYSYGSLLLLALVSAVISIIGDLSASLLKRENDIKDFGKILPGHGGIMDRFDSILFVAPLVLVWVQIFPIVTL